MVWTTIYNLQTYVSPGVPPPRTQFFFGECGLVFPKQVREFSKLLMIVLTYLLVDDLIT